MKTGGLRSWWWAVGLLILGIGFVLHLIAGKQSMPLDEVFPVLFGAEASEPRWETLLLQVRLPRTVTAMLAGMALAVSGLLMQTFFRNPLAGPYVLGISSGSNLGVALLIMTGTVGGGAWLQSGVGTWGIAIASVLGSLGVLMVVLAVASRVRDTVTLLIVGLMFASLTSGVVQILEQFSTPEQLNSYVHWTFGDTGGVTWKQLLVLGPVVFIGVVAALLLRKDLNAWLLGEQYARSLGMNVRRMKWGVIIATSLLAGGVTAFCGPIAFLGLAVPHLARALFGTSDHRILMGATILLGGGLLLFCDLIAYWPGLDKSLPLNGVMALLGAPVVIAIILKRKNLHQAF